MTMAKKNQIAKSALSPKDDEYPISGEAKSKKGVLKEAVPKEKPRKESLDGFMKRRDQADKAKRR
jgi:hypothetical protein